MEPGLSTRGFRLVSFSLGLLSMVSLLTIGISVYQEFTFLTAGPEAFRPQAGMDIVGGEQVFFLNFTIPNRGLYPLDISAGLDATINGVLAVSGTSPIQRIPPGSEGIISFSARPDPKEVLGDREALQTIMFNGSRLELLFRVSVKMVPFVGFNTTIRQGQDYGGAISDLALSAEPPQEYNSTHSVARLRISAVNRSFIPISGRLYVTVVRTPLSPAEGDYGSGVTDVSFQPGEAGRGEVDVFIRNDSIAEGTYLLRFDLLSEQFTFSFYREMEAG